SSTSSQTTIGNSPYLHQQNQPTARQILASAINPSSSQSSLQNFSRPSPGQNQSGDLPRRTQSPLGRPLHRQREPNTQGFFEPTLASASPGLSNTTNPNLTASQIAAQAAMQQQQAQQHSRQRSQTVPNPHYQPETSSNRRTPHSPSAVQLSTT